MSVKPTSVTDDIYNYLLKNFAPEDEFLARLKREAAAIGMPDISITADQGAFLQFMLSSIKARYVLEIGSLAGYSAISMARVLPSDGKLVAIEINKEYAEFMQNKIEQAGLSDIVELYNAEAKEFLKNYSPGFKFDLVLIDADKTGYIEFFKMADRLIGNYWRGVLHGGVISSVLDATGGMIAATGIVSKMTGKAVEEFEKRLSRMGTIDLRIDYLRPGLGKFFIASGSIMRTGRRVSVTRMELHNDENRLIAVGTGTYVVG